MNSASPPNEPPEQPNAAADGGATSASQRPLLHPAVRFIVVLIAFVAVVAGISTPPSDLTLRMQWRAQPGPLWTFGVPLVSWLAGGFWVIRGTASWRSPVKRGTEYAVMGGIMVLLGLIILAGSVLWYLSMALGPVR